jgi:Zn-dependent M16 (insulinase) family peptidase
VVYKIKFVLFALLVVSASAMAADSRLEILQPDERIGDFRTLAVYVTGEGTRMGARFAHVQSGFVLDVLRIQSVPGAFTWVNSIPPSDCGEPHTCEHLLLGKGTVGRYVASLEEMSLGESSAFTEQVRTCYHFRATAGTATFFDLFEAKLNAMLHPNYSDEEIRREVCNTGVKIDQTTGKPALEEKGTVYNEMVSSYEKPYGNLYQKLGEMIFGKGHPMSLSAGGVPEAIRKMTPTDLRNFQESTHHLNNMGSVVSIPEDVTLEDCLTKLSAILKRIEPDATPGKDPATLMARIPAPHGEPAGTMTTTWFPSGSNDAPGLLLYAWPAQLTLMPQDRYLFELFTANLSQGQTSNLHRKFIESKSRVMDVGASSVFGFLSNEVGSPLYIGLDDIRATAVDEVMMDSIRKVIVAEIGAVANYADNSEELRLFNDRIRNRIIEQQRSTRTFLNSPTGFGNRGTGSNWLNHLQSLNESGGFVRDLTQNGFAKWADSLLALPANIWRDYVAQWKLTSTLPYAVGTRPDVAANARTEAERIERMNAFADSLVKAYSAATRDDAIAKFKIEYDALTATIDSTAATIPMPMFVQNPPLTLDDQLDYSVESLPGGGKLVTSIFDNISSVTCGLAFRADVIPDSLLFLVPAIPICLTEIGVVKDGKTISYDEMSERIRREILSLSANYSVNYRTERVELMLTASGSNLAEGRIALDWMRSALFNSNIRPDNISRIRDAVDQNYAYTRGRINSSEESWVDEPTNAFWRQHNPLLLSADCFLTQTYDLFRLRWRLRNNADTSVVESFCAVMDKAAASGNGMIREQWGNFLNDLSAERTTPHTAADILRADRDKLPALSRTLFTDAIDDLKNLMAGMPDNSLEGDMKNVIAVMTKEIRIPLAQTFSQITSVIRGMEHRDNVRGYIVASRASSADVAPVLGAIVKSCATAPSERQAYSPAPRVSARVAERTSDSSQPLFVGLVNENTRAGIHYNTSNLASFEDSEPEKLLSFLSARLYGGGGAHSMFMKTWSAGLAYSNGLRSNEMSGRLMYYAERCPELAQTMSFVTDQLKSAPYDTGLADYAVSQAFAVNRAGNGYEQRGMAMANDLADGLLPEDVSRFRSGIMNLRKEGHLYDRLHKRMESTYGEVLPGYGPTAKDVAKTKPDLMNFVIGPEKQILGYEEYLKRVEDPNVKLVRLYPRDYWQVEKVKRD